MKMTWKQAAEYAEEVYGTFVDWTEGFFICPECGEPIYKDDYGIMDSWNVCPICEYVLCEDDEEELEDDDSEEDEDYEG